jgi:short-subunit dehydrogenase
LPTPVGPNSAMISMRIGSQVVKINGSTVLLTGATGGIGHAIARALSARGARLALTGRRTDVLEPLAAELKARSFACDLSDAADVDRLLAQVGDVDILLANAALPASGRLESFSVVEIDRALDVNLRAPIVLTHALSPAMIARGRGHLVFISSLAGKASSPGAALYSASKFGLRGFASALRADLRGSGVGVSTIFPGFIRDAGMYADVDVALPAGVGTRSPQDVARAVIRAIEHNRGEIDVAPLSLRAGSLLAGIAPELAASAARRLGSDDISAKMAAAQQEKR